jgi:predicted nucleic acid-binding protein
MQLVIDANILFAALIKNSTTARLIVSPKLSLFAPRFLLDEFSLHKTEILGKLHRDLADFNKVLKIFKSRIKFIDEKALQSEMASATDISPDPKDTIYFALALKKKISIWSNDKALRSQEQVKIYTTGEIVQLINED